MCIKYITYLYNLYNHNRTPFGNTDINIVTHFNLESEALMINTDITKYALLKSHFIFIFF